MANSSRAIDQPIAGLLADLSARGLLEDTVVVWGGEFGRTPTSQGGDGRDHNNKGFSMWMAGGGVKPGIAMAATLTVIHENTGLAVDSLRKVLPPANEPICSLNPTQVGERVGMSARAINTRLQSLGFQFKNDRELNSMKVEVLADSERQPANSK